MKYAHSLFCPLLLYYSLLLDVCDSFTHLYKWWAQTYLHLNRMLFFVENNVRYHTNNIKYSDIMKLTKIGIIWPIIQNRYFICSVN